MRTAALFAAFLLGSSQTWAAVCDTTYPVGAAQTYTTIQAAVDAVPSSLADNPCVELKDVGPFAEQVSVFNKVSNGFRLTIRADPALGSQPVVNPPALSTAAFWVASASVSVENILIQPSAAVTYGVFASSAFVNISTVNVDSNNRIGLAGIRLTTSAFVYNSSVTAVNSHAFWVTGSSNVVAVSTGHYQFTTAPFRHPLFLDGASHNTFVSFIATATAASPKGVRFLNATHNLILGSTIAARSSALELIASSFNVVAQTRIFGSFNALLELSTSYANLFSDDVLSGLGTFGGVRLVNSSSNAFTGSSIKLVSSLSSAQGVFLSSSHANAILRSTIAVDGVGTGFAGLQVIASSHNLVSNSGVIARTANVGLASTVDLFGFGNAVVASSVTSSNASLIAFRLSGSSSSVADSRIVSGSTIALSLFGSFSQVVRSTITTASNSQAFYIQPGAVGNAVRESYIESLTAGARALAIFGSSTTVSRSTAIANDVAIDINSAGASYNALSQVFARGSGSNPTVRLNGPASKVSSCTFTGTAAAGSALLINSVNGASSTITDSVFSNTLGISLNIINAPSVRLERSSAASFGASAALSWAGNYGSLSDLYVQALSTGVSFGGVLNSVSRSTVSTSVSGTAFSLGGASNTVASSFLINNGIGPALRLSTGAVSNAVLTSTIASNDAGSAAAHYVSVSSNAIYESYIRNASGSALRFESGSRLNTVALSTVSTNNSLPLPAIDFAGGSSNTVTRSRLSNSLEHGPASGPVVWFREAARHSALSSSTLTGENAAAVLDFQSAAAFNTVTGSVIRNRGGYAVRLSSQSNANYLSGNDISLSLGGAGSPEEAGIAVQSSSSNLIVHSLVRAPHGRAVAFLEGATLNTVLLSTLTSAAHPAVVMDGLGLSLTSSNTVSRCYVQGSTGVVLRNAIGGLVESSVIISTEAAGIGVQLTDFAGAPSLGLALRANAIRGGAAGTGVQLDAGSLGALELSTNSITGARTGVSVAAQGAGASVFIASNTILGAVSTAYSTYGLRFAGLTTGATVQNNAIVWRDSGSMGAGTAYGLQAQGSSGLLVRNNRFSQPARISGGGFEAVSLDGTTNSELRLNDILAAGSGLSSAYGARLENGSTGVQFKDNVLQASFTVSGASAALSVSADSQAGFVSDYNDFYSSGAAQSALWGGAAASLLAGWQALSGQDANSISADPYWTAPLAEDFHPRSTGGRFDPAAADYVLDSVHSPVIDAGNPVAAFALEPPFNGGRANMGSYGDAPQASKSAPPSGVGRPGAPTGTALGRSSITWTWSAASGASSYKVYRASSPGTVLGTPAGTAFVDAFLATGTAYGIWVAAVGGGGESVISSGAASTLAAPPIGGALSAFGAVDATFYWSLNGNPAGTLAEVHVSTDNSYYTLAASTNAGSALISGLAGCTLHFLKVRHKNGDGVASDFDSPVAFTTSGSTPTSASGLSARTLEGGRVALSWTPSTHEGVTGYSLYSDGGTGSVNYSAPLGLAAGSEFTTEALVSSAAYRFVVRAKHRCGVEEPGGVSVTAPAASGLSAVRAAVTAPEAGRRVWGDRVTVAADVIAGAASQVSSVLFQYKPAASASWTDIPAAAAGHPNPDSNFPYYTHFDVTGLAAGDYDIRARASDTSANADTYPASVRVSVDPAAPDLTEALASGLIEKRVTLSNAIDNTIRAGGTGSTDPVLKLVIPAGALSSAAPSVTVVANPALTTGAPAGFSFSGSAARITLSNGQTALSNGKTAAITLSYPDTVTDPSLLSIYAFDDALGRWVQDFASTVDSASRTVTGATPHFSFFAALIGTASGSSDGVRVYPVPYKPFGPDPRQGRPYSAADASTGITFDRLPAAVTLRIYTLSGRLVAQFETPQSNGTIRWDARTDDGRDAASGGYLAVISSPGQKPVVRPLVIIR